jgi:hypothetical protein
VKEGVPLLGDGGAAKAILPGDMGVGGVALPRDTGVSGVALPRERGVVGVSLPGECGAGGVALPVVRGVVVLTLSRPSSEALLVVSTVTVLLSTAADSWSSQDS